MLKHPTLFIIGAGTGDGLNMPLGSTLSATIARHVDIAFEMDSRKVSGDDVITAALRRFARARSMNPNDLFAAGRSISKGIRSFRSVDNFIAAQSNNENIKTVAKFAIVRSIVAAEKECYLFVDNDTGKYRSDDAVFNSWLPDFAFLLAENLTVDKDLDTIFDSLRIINFNYDRCIEQYLYSSLPAMFPSKNPTYFADLINKKLKVIRPYGSVGSQPAILSLCRAPPSWCAASRAFPWALHALRPPASYCAAH
jgi:hypothetical protein